MMTAKRRSTIILILLALVVLATVAVKYARPITDGDIWFHLAYGRYLVENGTLIPDHSVFSWTPTDASRIYTVWLPDILFYELHKAGGMIPLYALRFFFILIFILLAAHSALKDPPVFLPLALLVCLSGLLMSMFGLHIKAELFSFLFMTLTVWTWFTIKASPERNRFLSYLLPLYMLLWANSHGGFIFGSFFLGMILTGEVLNLLTRAPERLDARTRKHLFIAIILSFLALLVTPHGLNYPIDILKHMVIDQEEFSMHSSVITEYLSIFNARNMQVPMIVYLFSSLAILAMLLYANGLKRTADWTLLFIHAPFIILYMKYMRATSYWSIIFVFSSLYLMRRLAQDGRDLAQKEPQRSIVHVAVYALLLSYVAYTQYGLYKNGLGTEYITPVEEARFIQSNFPQARIGNDYISGSYLMWKLWPGNKVFIDARYFPYHAWFEKYHAFSNGTDKAYRESFLQQYPCDLWLMSYSSHLLINHFMSSPEWRLVYYGPSACVFLSKRIPYPQGHGLSPSVYRASPFHAASIASVALMAGDIDVAKRLLPTLKTHGFYSDHQSEVSRIEREIDRQEKIFGQKISLLEKTLTAMPGNPQLIQALVLNYAKVGDYENAILHLKKLHDQYPDKPELYYNIACMYAKMNKIEESVSWLDKAIQKGFSDWGLIRSDSDLDNIRNTSFFKELMKKH